MCYCQMPHHMFQRKTVNIQSKICNQIRKYQEASPLKCLCKPPAPIKKSSEHCSGCGKIHQSCSLACKKYQKPVFCKEIKSKAGYISACQHTVIVKIFFIIQVQTVFHISVITKNCCHKKGCRPENNRQRYHGIPCHKKSDCCSHSSKQQKEDIIVPVFHLIISSYNKTAGIQRLPHRRTEYCNQPHKIQKLSQLVASHFSVQQRIYNNLQNPIHQKRSAYGIHCI